MIQLVTMALNGLILWRLSVMHISITLSLTYSLLQKGWPQTVRQLLLQW